MEIANLALNGLMERQRAIASNTANVLTPNYQRKEVSFEQQLDNIIARDDVRQDIRAINGALPPANTQKTQVPDDGFIPYDTQQKGLSAEQLKFLSQKDYNQFDPEIMRDYSQFDIDKDNNVNLEKEMMDMAKTSMKYNVLATMQARSFSSLSEVIKSGG